MIPSSIILLSATTLVSIIQSTNIRSTCNIGDKVENECHECVCTQNMYICKALQCNNTLQINPPTDQEKILPSCQPNMMYVEKSTTCICDHNGLWPHKHCYNLFGYLPEEKIRKQQCDPGSYVIVSCNVCFCGPNGKIDESKCTKNDCTNSTKRSRRTSIDKVYGNCDPRNWYSFAPCQFCYCMNENKLICNTGNRLNAQPVDLGTYKLTECGKNMIHDAVDLMPEGDKVFRLGIVLGNKTITKPVRTTRKPYQMYSTSRNIYTKRVTPPFVKGINAQLNREYNEKHLFVEEKAEDDASTDEDEEYAKRTVQKHQKHTKLQVKTGQSTAIPNENGNVVSSESNEMYLEINDDVVTPRFNSQNITNVDIPGINFTDSSININFPTVLDKILSMALRKSMVRLDSGKNCTAGAEETVDCNTCYCLVNGKMLCTEKNCGKH